MASSPINNTNSIASNNPINTNTNNTEIKSTNSNRTNMYIDLEKNTQIPEKKNEGKQIKGEEAIQ